MVCLGYEFIRNWLQQNGLIIFGRHEMGWSGLAGLSLAMYAESLLLGFSLQGLVLLDTLQKVGTALAVGDVLNSDIDPLGEDLATDALVYNNS